MKSFSYQNIRTLQIEFEEKSRKGSVSFIGEFTTEKPAFKFTFEKQADFTEKDRDILL